MQTVLDMFGRMVAGPLLILLGTAMLIGLALLSSMPADDVYGAAGIFIGVQTYSIVAFLFVLVGLRHTLGPKSWIDNLAEKSAGRVVGIAILGSLIVGTLWLVAVL